MAPPVQPGYRNVAYYVNWAIYGRNYQPQDLPADELTHVLYAFANVNNVTGEVFLTDSYSDAEKHYSTDSWNDNGTNLYGCLKQLYLLKKKNRNMKLVLSVGGWSYRGNFAGPMSTAKGRQTFADSSAALLKDYPIDGIEIDWEYPETVQEGQDFVELVKVTRAALDAYASTLSSKPHFLLAGAFSASPDHYKNLPFAQIDPYLDFWNLMAYDFAGGFSNMSGHQANVYNSTQMPAATPYSADFAVQSYIQGGVPSSKINFAMPLYGRAFTNTAGPGLPYNGTGPGSWEDGVWDYKALPRPNATVNYDPQAIAAWTYDSGSHTMITYDNPRSVGEKVDYIKRSGLGGAMFWETSGDKSRASGESLINLVYQGLGGYAAKYVEQSQNCLEYTSSKWDNLRAGMPNE